jgi:thioredoxin type arsenate reductase
MSEPRLPVRVVSEPPKRVVFVCVRNSARSQMAEGLARALAPAGTEVWSAGTEPGGVHPAAVEAMREAGIDISDQHSKGLDDVPWREADTVVTLCGEAQEACPVVPIQVRKLHWPLPDPAKAPEAARLQAFRETRDELRWRIASLWPRSG